jgi:hypothetical protein
MKIAVCLSGQPRTWIQCYESWNLLFSELKKNKHLEDTNIEVDYFIHTWDFNSKPYSVWTRERWGIEGFLAPPADYQTSDEIFDYVIKNQPKNHQSDIYKKSEKNKSVNNLKKNFKLLLKDSSDAFFDGLKHEEFFSTLKGNNDEIQQIHQYT